ncbi:MAG: OmpH family outer membrane protein [Phycisphaerales bacterium]
MNTIARVFRTHRLASIVVTAVAMVAVMSGWHIASGRLLEPAVVVSVRLSTVLDHIEETQRIRNRLKAMDDVISTEVAVRRTAIEAAQDELETLANPSRQFDEHTAEIMRLAAELEAWYSVKKQLREREETREYLRMYDKVLIAIAAMSEERGYGFVLLDDSDLHIAPGTPEETAAQLFHRRMLYASPAHDVSQDLIDRMNAQQ